METPSNLLQIQQNELIRTKENFNWENATRATLKKPTSFVTYDIGGTSISINHAYSFFPDNSQLSMHSAGAYNYTLPQLTELITLLSCAESNQWILSQQYTGSADFVCFKKDDIPELQKYASQLRNSDQRQDSHYILQYNPIYFDISDFNSLSEAAKESISRNLCFKFNIGYVPVGMSAGYDFMYNQEAGLAKVSSELVQKIADELNARVEELPERINISATHKINPLIISNLFELLYQTHHVDREYQLILSSTHEDESQTKTLAFGYAGLLRLFTVMANQFAGNENQYDNTIYMNIDGNIVQIVQLVDYSLALKSYQIPVESLVNNEFNQSGFALFPLTLNQINGLSVTERAVIHRKITQGETFLSSNNRFYYLFDETSNSMIIVGFEQLALLDPEQNKNS